MSSKGPWLLGIPGAPLIPRNWVGGHPWSVQLTYERIGDVRRLRRMSSVELALPGTTPADATESDLAQWARVLVPTVAAARPEWWTGSLDTDFPALSADLRVDDLPLLISTSRTLRDAGFSDDCRLIEVLETPRDVLAHGLASPLSLLDFEFTLSHWVAEMALSPLVRVVSEEDANLDSVARALIAEYLNLDGNRLGSEWIGALQQRLSWGAPKATLQELGDSLSLTRERVRQVLARVESRLGLRRWALPALLADIVESMEAASYARTPEVILSSGLTHDDDWTTEEIASLIEWFGYPRIADGIRAKAEEARAAASNPELVRALRKGRAITGIAQLTSIAYKDQLLTVTEAEKGLKSIYSRVYVAGEWALAGDAKSGMMENAAGRQFGVTIRLSTSELIEGLDRVRRNRAAPALPPESALLDLLVQSGSIAPDGTEWTGPIIAPEAGSINSWLVSLLEGADGHVMHREVITRLAIEDGHNTSSTNVYLGYSPLVRSVEGGTGLIRLVGRYPTQQECEHARDVAAATRIPTQFDAESSADGQSLNLHLLLGSYLFTTGVLSPPPPVKQSWPAEGTRISCICTHRFEGRVSISGTGMMVGWGPLLVHLHLDHGVREGSELTFSVSDGVLQLSSIS